MKILPFSRFAAGGAVFAIATLLFVASPVPAFALETESVKAGPLAMIPGSGNLGVDVPQPLGIEKWDEPTLLALPDLFVYTIQPVDANHNPVSTIVVGQAVYFKIAVANGGDANCTNSAIWVEIEMDSVHLDGGNINLTGLPPGTYTYIYTTIPWTATLGAHTTRMTIDLNNGQSESNESNNWKDYAFTTGTSSGSCDLAIDSEIQACDTSTNPVSSVVSGQQVIFRFHVANIGTAYPTATSVAITVTIDGTNLGGGSYNLTSLAPGYYVNFYSSTWTATPGNHTVVVTVDAYNSQAESNETNNSRSYPFTVASTCSISCSSAVPAAGQASSTVNFFGSAVLSSCSTNSVSYDWNYGDGSAHGSSQSASHSYGAAGTYSWTMTASSSGAVSCTQTGSIVISSTCTAPVITAQPQDVTIQPGTQTILTVGASGTPLVYQWFEGNSGDLARPIAYANSSWYTTEPLFATATYWVRISNGCGQIDSQSVIVTVNGGGANCTGTPVLLAAAAHSTGSGNTLWKTDVSVFNPGDSAVSVWLRFFPRDSDNGSAPCVSMGPISARSGAAFDDAVLSVFGLSSAAGGIGVYFGDGMALVGSRTYTGATGGGTYGQAIAGRQPAEAIASGETETLVQLEESSSYRTNIGFQNASNVVSSVEVKLYAQNGALLGTKNFTLAAYSQHQEGQIFRSVTTAEVRSGRAEIRVVSGGPVLAYASVVDSITGDPSYSEPID